MLPHESEASLGSLVLLTLLSSASCLDFLRSYEPEVSMAILEKQLKPILKPYLDNPTCADQGISPTTLTEAEMTGYLCEKGGSSYTQEDFEALLTYKGGHYHAINDYLRGVTTPFPSDILRVAALDQVFTRASRLPVDAVFYRGERLVPEGGFEVGRTYGLKTFTSTTMDLNTAMAFGGGHQLLKVKVPKGTPIVFYPQLKSLCSFAWRCDNVYWNESEVLLPRDSCWKVLSTKDKEVTLQFLRGSECDSATLPQYVDRN